MLSPKYRVKVLFVILLVGGGLVGCQTTAPPAESRALMAGKTTFIEVPSGQGPWQVIAYTEPGHAVCPECQRVAADYFRTGVLDETACKTCGATFVIERGEGMQR
jgi:hypothetical protein